MLGLIKKDLIVIMNNLKSLLILLVFYVIMIYMGKMDIFFLPAFLSMVLMLSTFNYDNYNKWDFYALTLPNGRKNIVKSKYATSILVTIIFTVISLLISLCFLSKVNILNTVRTTLYTILGITLFQAILYPVTFKLGIEKARIYIFVVVFMLVFLIGIVFKFVDFSFLNNLGFLKDYIDYFITLLVLGIFLISYKISDIIYSKRDL